MHHQLNNSPPKNALPEPAQRCTYSRPCSFQRDVGCPNQGPCNSAFGLHLVHAPSRDQPIDRLCHPCVVISVPPPDITRLAVPTLGRHVDKPPHIRAPGGPASRGCVDVGCLILTYPFVRQFISPRRGTPHCCRDRVLVLRQRVVGLVPRRQLRGVFAEIFVRIIQRHGASPRHYRRHPRRRNTDPMRPSTRVASGINRRAGRPPQPCR